MVPEGRDVVLDLVDVVFCNALVLGLTLLLRHVPTHQVTHNCLEKMVTVYFYSEI